MSMKKKAIFALLPFMAAGLATATIGLSTSPLMVEAADGEKEQLGTMPYAWSDNGLPYIALGYEADVPVVATPGDIRVNWLSDVKAIYNDPEADIAYRFTAYSAGKEAAVDATAPDLDLSDPLFTFDFKENGFISVKTILSYVRSYVQDENPDFDRGTYIGFTGQVVDLNGIYADGPVATLGNSFRYLTLSDPQANYSETLSINEDGSLNLPWLNVYDTIMPEGGANGRLGYELGIYDLGAEAVDGLEAIDPLAMEPVATFTFDEFANITASDIVEALTPHNRNANDFYGIAVRTVALNESAGLADSDWSVFSGSFQYGKHVNDLFSTYTPVISSYPEAQTNLPNLFDEITNAGYQFNGDGAWSAGVEKHVYLLVDLTFSRNIESLTISWERARAAEFDVYVGDPYLDWEKLGASTDRDNGNALFEDSLADDWKGYEPLTFTTGTEDANLTQTYEINRTGRYVLLDLKTPIMGYGYNIFDISAVGTTAEHSYAYYALKNALDTTGCADFSNDQAKAEEFHAMLSDLMGQLTEEDKAALRTVTPTYEYDESEDKTAYPQDYMALADFLLAKSEFYSSKTDSPAALVEKGESLNVALGAGALVISAAAAGAFFLLKKKKAN